MKFTKYIVRNDLWRRHLLQFIGFAFLGLTAATALSFALRKQYQSETTLAVVSGAGQSSSPLAAIAGAGGLGAALGVGGGRSNLDQIVALIQTNDVLDDLVRKFELSTILGSDKEETLRKRLRAATRIWVGIKDQLIRIEVTVPDSALAANLANELGSILARRVTELASSEAMSRRVFLEAELVKASERLDDRQRILLQAKLSPGMTKAEVKTTGEMLMRLYTDLGNAEAKIAVAQQGLRDGAPELERLRALRNSIQSQITKASTGAGSDTDSGYIAEYRAYKQAEAVHEIIYKQFELARIDELKGGQYVHVVQIARAQIKPISPNRLVFAISGLILGLLGAGGIFFTKWRTEQKRNGPETE